MKIFSQQIRKKKTVKAGKLRKSLFRKHVRKGEKISSDLLLFNLRRGRRKGGVFAI